MSRILEVWLHGRCVGDLTQGDDGRLTFRYRETWVDDPSAAPVSVSLPLRPGTFAHNEARPFFAGLLPEDANRELIAREFGVSRKNDFALLDRIGRECAGAVSLVPPGEPWPATSPVAGEPLSSVRLEALLSALPRRPLLAGEQGVRLSLAGAQNKMAVIKRGADYLLPIGGAPSSHILKPQSPHFAHLVENEWCCMTLAAAAGLPVAPVARGAAGGQSFLEIARYDRVLRLDGVLDRIHQEDFCQALGIVPELKYQTEGGPNLKRCFALLRAESTAAAADLLVLFDGVVFNFLIGNSDAHGKNFSLLRGTGGVRLAPFYDLVCTQIYPETDRGLAMKIGDERDPARIRLRNWQRFAKDAGLNPTVATRRLRDIMDRVAAALGTVTVPAGAESVAALVRENCERLQLEMNRE